MRPDASWSVAGIGDFNDDGKSDVLWRNSNGSLAEWLMDGATIGASSALTFNGVAVTPDASWYVVEIGDFNGDGSADILWRNDNGTVNEWLMNGSTITPIADTDRERCDAVTGRELDAAGEADDGVK